MGLCSLGLAACPARRPRRRRYGGFAIEKFRRAAQERARVSAGQQRLTREGQLRPGYKIWGYKNVFAKGFLISEGPHHYLPRENWEGLSLGAWHLIHDPALEVHTATSPHAGVLVLGQAFDAAGRRETVASRVLKAFERDLAQQRPDPTALDEAVTWLSGRFVLVAWHPGGIFVYNDPLATRACYWHQDASGVALASHTALLAEFRGGLPATRSQWALRHPEYRAPAGRWMPGLITAHDDVLQVYANGRLAVRSMPGGAASVSHDRFFPRADREERRPDEVFEDFRDDLRQQVRNWLSVAPVSVLTLTAGADSRAVLDAGLDLLQAAESLALTYHPFSNPGKSTYADLAEANRLATSARLPHLVVDVLPISRASQMAALYQRTFPTYQRYQALAGALYLAAPARGVTMFGVGGAVITGMFKDISDPVLTPQLLARKYAQSAFAEDPALHREFEAWMHYAQFSVEALRGHSFYDFFHWEHRMSKWGAEGYLEYDLATIPGPVLSSRRLLLAALSLSPEDRSARALYRLLRVEPPQPARSIHS